MGENEKLYVVINDYDCEYYDVLGLFNDKKLAIEKAKYFIRKHKTSIDIREYEPNTFSDDGILVYHAYWSYTKDCNKPVIWRFFEGEGSSECRLVKEIVEDGKI